MIASGSAYETPVRQNTATSYSSDQCKLYAENGNNNYMYVLFFVVFSSLKQYKSMPGTSEYTFSYNIFS